MQQSLPILSEDSPEFREWITDLLQDTQKKLIVVISSIYLLWLFVAGVMWPEMLFWQLWAVFASLLVISRISFLILSKHLQAAQIFWLIGMVMVNLLAIFLFNRPEIALFFVLFPLLAVLLRGRWGGLLAEAGVAALMLWLSRGPFAAQVEPYVTIVIAGGAICGVLGWITSDTLVTQYQYSFYNSRRATHSLDEARQHRAQLVRVFKDLDMAYYRLERANAALVAAWKDAERAEQVKSEIVTFVSHEMRTPLNLIAGFSEMMLKSPVSYGGVGLPAVYEADLSKIAHSAAHLLALVDDVIDLSRFDVGKIGMTWERVNLDALVNEAAGMVRDYIGTKGLDLHLTVAPDLPSLWIDRLRIRQVLLNLLVNAARFTEKGYIALEVAREPDHVVVKVHDTGKGIAPENLTRVFEEYHTTDQAQTTWHSGSGLGLPISKKLVEFHQGTVGVESALGLGTTFWFTLPIPAQTAEESTSEGGRILPFHTLPIQPESAEKICVVVNEDPQIAPLFQRYLSGYRLLGATDASAGLQLAKECRAIALLTDHDRPLPELPENLLVARCPLPSTSRAVDLWSVAVLPKPVMAADLLAAVERVHPAVERVLIVDDDQELVELFCRMLGAYLKPENCLTAYNGLDALNQARQHKPDLILLDLMMPELDGYGVLAELRSDPELARTPVIILSAKIQEDAGLGLTGPILLSRGNGFKLGEVVRTLEAAFNALAPGWQAGAQTAPKSAAAPVG